MSALNPIRYGKYQVVGPLATGGMADLFLARARGPSGFEMLAVVKRIRPHLAANPEFVRLFVGEARLAAQLRHPNVVSVYDAGTERGEYYFVMEFVHGRDLRGLMDAADKRQRLISYDEATSIAAGLCAGLHHAHQRQSPDGQPLGIVHRDISPSNVLVSYEGAVKLADFGIAKATQLAKEPGTGTLRGKLSYMSPEQCLNEPLDRRSDLYSLALVLYEVTTGQKPQGVAANEFIAMQRRLEGRVRPPSELRADYPRDLERIVMRGLERQRELRYPTARDMQIDLEAFARTHRLALSSMTLARMMEELFGEELEAWQQARQRGTSLEEYVAVSRTLSVGGAPSSASSPLDSASLPTTVHPHLRPWRARAAIATALVVAASFVLAIALRKPASRSPSPLSSVVVAPSPLASPPVVVAPSPSASPPVVVAPSPLASPPSPPVAAPPAPDVAAAPLVEASPQKVRAHPSKRALKRKAWDPEAPVLPH
jgi:serine/threonine protein kinase